MQKGSYPSLRKALRGGIALGLSRIYYLALRATYLYLLVDQIGVPAYGAFSYAQSWYVLLLPIAVWGGNELLLSGLLQRSGARQRDFVGTALTLRLTLGLLCFLTILSVALFVEERNDLRLLMIVFAQGVVLRSVTAVATSLCVARGRSLDWVLISSVSTTIEVPLVLGLAKSGATLPTLALAHTSIWWLTLGASFCLYSFRFGAIRLAWDRKLALWFLHEGAILGLASFLMLALSPALLLTYRYLTPGLAELGTVAVVLQVFTIAQQLLTLATNALLPALRGPTSSEGCNLVGFTRSALSVALCIGGAIALISHTAIPQLLTILPTTPFDEALSLLAQHAWVFTPLLVVSTCRLALIASGETRSFLLAMLGATASALLVLLSASVSESLNPQSVLHGIGVGLSVGAVLQLSFCYFLGFLSVEDRRSFLHLAGLITIITVSWLGRSSVPPALLGSLGAFLLILGVRQFLRLRKL